MTERTFTREELAKFDGEDGREAYVAVNGVVYDMTGNPHVKASAHHGNLAGQDITEAIMRSGHGDKVMAHLKVVGKLVD
ncbi:MULTISPECIES: cytochrome b5 domain-containing protein [Lactobacillus]|uniref:Cytochrome B5 n=1 Tax=Lactobacillus xujianguonis TaxID=2495899 RepID=A0A437SVK1_9LACO|nr:MULTISPECIES: cytochrome b5 domain-containing protein [Lactobacillus]RVU70954.1 cytochrome B5 [Lactobacillus xujianguonis]RVU73427.1 cytochrome B5 [Lactobacillus xujianguonis]